MLGLHHGAQRPLLFRAADPKRSGERPPPAPNASAPRRRPPQPKESRTLPQKPRPHSGPGPGRASDQGLIRFSATGKASKAAWSFFFSLLPAPEVFVARLKMRQTPRPGLSWFSRRLTWRCVSCCSSPRLFNTEVAPAGPRSEGRPKAASSPAPQAPRPGPTAFQHTSIVSTASCRSARRRPFSVTISGNHNKEPSKGRIFRIHRSGLGGLTSTLNPLGLQPSPPASQSLHPRMACSKSVGRPHSTSDGFRLQGSVGLGV